MTTLEKYPRCIPWNVDITYNVSNDAAHNWKLIMCQQHFLNIYYSPPAYEVRDFYFVCQFNWERVPQSCYWSCPKSCPRPYLEGTLLPRPGWGGGVPGQKRGCLKTGQGVLPPPHLREPGMPLTFMQEDFLVLHFSRWIKKIGSELEYTSSYSCITYPNGDSSLRVTFVSYRNRDCSTVSVCASELIVSLTRG